MTTKINYTPAFFNGTKLSKERIIALKGENIGSFENFHEFSSSIRTSTDPIYIDKFKNSSVDSIKFAIAYNPHTNIETLLTLKDDSDSRIAKIALENLIIRKNLSSFK